MIEVIPGVWCASLSEVQDPKVVKGFGAVLGCCEGSAASVPRVLYGRLAKPDGVLWTEEDRTYAANFIREGLGKGKVLVFSDMGLSRCAAAVVFFLVAEGRSLEEALKFVEEKGLKPHPGIFEEPSPAPSRRGPELSVVVVTWNRKELVQRCMESLLRTVPAGTQIIVVDNGSTDGTVEYLETLPVELVKLDRNYGKGVALNIGITKARGEYFLLLDSDIVLPEGWYDEILKFLREDTGWITLPYEGMDLPERFLKENLYEAPSVDGGMVFGRREVFEKIGRFREDVLLGGIDTDYMNRTRSKGLRVGYTKSDLKLIHLGKEESPRYRAWKEMKVPQYVTPSIPLLPVEIIVVRYNLFEIEQQCIESVLQRTNWEYRLTVVDNYETKKPIGVLWNELIDASSFSFICLLNSDTVVTEGWLTRLMSTFSFDPRIAVVGPSTNMAGSVQKIAPELPFEKMEEFARKLASEWKGQWDKASLSGFCYLLRKDVWEKLGGFHPDFRHYGQESYFNWLCEKNGLWTVWRKDAFVWHWGRASVKAAVERGEFNYEEEVRYARDLLQKLKKEAE